MTPRSFFFFFEIPLKGRRSFNTQIPDQKNVTSYFLSQDLSRSCCIEQEVTSIESVIGDVLV